MERQIKLKMKSLGDGLTQFVFYLRIQVSFQG
jgi:hypothetical protein